MEKVKTIWRTLWQNEGRPKPITMLDAWRVGMHLPLGWATVESVDIHWIIAPVLAWVFIKYELNEEKHEKDKAFKDILGMLLGMVGTVIWKKYVG